MALPSGRKVGVIGMIHRSPTSPEGLWKMLVARGGRRWAEVEPHPCSSYRVIMVMGWYSEIFDYTVIGFIKSRTANS